MKLSKMKKANLGFTLVELLIVITLVGILSAFFINTSQNSLKISRDGKRKTDLEQIRAGIETYRADCNSYPLTSEIAFTYPSSSLVGDGTPTNCRATNTYINAIPTDPQRSAGTSYRYASAGTTYEICAALETGTGTVTCGGLSTCGSSTCNYKVTSP